jgi:hypothetical protein
MADGKYGPVTEKLMRIFSVSKKKGKNSAVVPEEHPELGFVGGGAILPGTPEERLENE